MSSRQHAYHPQNNIVQELKLNFNRNSCWDALSYPICAAVSG